MKTITAITMTNLDIQKLYNVYNRNINRYVKLFGTATGSYLLGDIIELGEVLGKSKAEIIQEINDRRDRYND